jgi:hypothetical protein
MPEAVIAWAVPIAAVLVAAAGLGLSVLQYLRSNYERVDRLLDETTTGDIAEARHRLGSERWIRSETNEPRSPLTSNDTLIKALYRLAWTFDRIYAVRRTVRFGPRGVIDDCLGDWVKWWGADSGNACRYGRTAVALRALGPEEHAHLALLVTAMGHRACTSRHAEDTPSP